MPAEPECTCKVVAPRHEFALGGIFRQAVYVDTWEDRTKIDPACPYHGENGTMVVKWPCST